MEENKMHLINKLFNNETIRTVWDKEQEKYYVSVVDVVGVLSGSENPRKYWNKLKQSIKTTRKSNGDKLSPIETKSSRWKISYN